jgi:S-adenosylmethionine decarboxylase proenzyme
MRSLFLFLFLCIGASLLSAPNEPGTYQFVGRHLVASYHGCDRAALSNTKRLAEVLEQACRASGATILDSCQYRFDGNGLTMVILLSESHASIHTYPEHGACFVDIFTCGHTCSQEKFNTVLQEYLKPTRPNCTYFERK